MSVRRIATITLAAFAVLAFPAVAAAPKKVSAEGVGKVKLGKTHRSLNRKGLVGRKRRGCELAGPRARAAKLRGPLKGAVDLTRTNPRRVKSIIVTAGATARGVGIGDKQDDILAAYPKATVDRSTKAVFGVKIVKVPKSGGGRIQFAVRPGTQRITLIGVPRITFCE